MTTDRKPVRLKRYEPTEPYDLEYSMRESPKGAWIQYQDHQRLMRIAREAIKDAYGTLNLASQGEDEGGEYGSAAERLQNALASLGEE